MYDIEERSEEQLEEKHDVQENTKQKGNKYLNYVKKNFSYYWFSCISNRLF